MHATPDFDPKIAFELTFADIGPQWQCDEDPPFFFDRHLRYAESIPTALIGAAENLCQEAEESKRPNFPFIESGLIDTPAFNCFARREKAYNRYHVAMSVAVPLAALELACHYFSFDHLFSNIGDPHRGPMVRLDGCETPPMFQLLDGKVSPQLKTTIDKGRAKQIGESLLKAAGLAVGLQECSPRHRGTDLFRLYDTALELMMPECPIRRMHCEYMSYALLHFLWIHEISHITSGHLIELRKRTGSDEANFHEFSLGQFASSTMDENMDCLAMEFDADIEAAVIMLGLIMSDMDIESDDAPYVSRTERISLLTFAIVAFYTSVAARESATERVGTHPPALLRLENILIHLAGIVASEGDLQNAMVDGLALFRAHAAHCQYAWMPDLLTEQKELSIATGKWWEVTQHRVNISTGYDEHRLGNLRVFMGSLEDELSSSSLWKIGPEPAWWRKDT